MTKESDWKTIVSLFIDDDAMTSGTQKNRGIRFGFSELAEAGRLRSQNSRSVGHLFSFADVLVCSKANRRTS